MRPATRDVSTHIINPNYGLVVRVVACHYTADVDCHSAPPCMFRKRDLRSGLKLWQAYGTATASANLLATIAQYEMYRQAEQRRTNHVGTYGSERTASGTGKSLLRQSHATLGF